MHRSVQCDLSSSQDPTPLGADEEDDQFPDFAGEIAPYFVKSQRIPPQDYSPDSRPSAGMNSGTRTPRNSQS